MEETLTEVLTMRRFAGIELFRDRTLDKTRSCPLGTCWRSTSLVSRSLGSSKLTSVPGEWQGARARLLIPPYQIGQLVVSSDSLNPCYSEIL